MTKLATKQHARFEAARFRNDCRIKLIHINRQREDASRRIKLKTALGDDLGAVQIENEVIWIDTQIASLKRKLGEDQ